jgi:hypothetical protein
MRRMTLIRLGLASVLVGGVIAAGAFATGCGGDDNGSKPGSGDDSGADATNIPPGDDGSTPGDDGGPVVKKDGGGDGSADAAPAPVHGKVILVNASAFAPPLRFCYGSVTTFDGGDAGSVTVLPVVPSPNTALGVPPGTGGPAADSTTDLKDRTLEIYAINSASVATVLPSDGGAELTCDKLIGSKALAADAGGLGLTQGVDYWDIGTLPAGTLADETTTLLAVNGCTPGEVNTSAALVECPSGYNPAVGDLGLWTAKLDTTTALDGGSIGAQFAYASYPFSLVASTMGGNSAVAGFYVNTEIVPDAGAPEDGGDAGDAALEAAAPIPVTIPLPIAQGVTYGQLAPMSLASVQGVTFDGTSGFFVKTIAGDGGATQIQAAIPLPSIQAISAPNADAGIFANGVGYVFVLVGNPTQPSFTVPDGGDAGSFNLLSAHILAFPTNPPFGGN